MATYAPSLVNARCFAGSVSRLKSLRKCALFWDVSGSSSTLYFRTMLSSSTATIMVWPSWLQQERRGFSSCRILVTFHVYSFVTKRVRVKFRVRLGVGIRVGVRVRVRVMVSRVWVRVRVRVKVRVTIEDGRRHTKWMVWDDPS